MSPVPKHLARVLTETGYLIDGDPAPGVLVGAAARHTRRRGTFEPDALWRSASNLTVYFKYAAERPNDSVVGGWRREIWNEGIAPLMWLVTPSRIELLNGFGRPTRESDVAAHLLRTFKAVESELRRLNAWAGRLAMESGQFWATAPGIDASTRVDQQLLADLARLEQDLVAMKVARSEAQALIGRTIFAQYLVDREIVSAKKLQTLTGYPTLSKVLRHRTATAALFKWLRETFNGDMFPEASMPPPGVDALIRIADFLDAVNEQGQASLFPYQFDVIPVEFISSIYEQFAHSVHGSKAHPRSIRGRPQSSATELGVYYTRVPVVSLVLDEVMDEITGDEGVLDLTCGSGVFLVEAFRRLVYRKAGNTPPRRIIRDVLYRQIHGVDISGAAIRVAAFSLYLAALELDPDPTPAEALRFEPLIGRSLQVADAHEVSSLKPPNGRYFEIIVGNPPWTYRGKGAAAQRRFPALDQIVAPRSEGLDFVWRALHFAGESTRFGMVLGAPPFFASSKSGVAAVRALFERLRPITLVNLASLRGWLFPGAAMPAVVLFARHRDHAGDDITVVQIPWSAASEITHTFEISPSDMRTLRFSDWVQEPARLKVAAIGRRRDLALFDRLREEFSALSVRLKHAGGTAGDGLVIGDRSRDSTFLVKARLPYLGAKQAKRFHVSADLDLFMEERAQWPRTRERYKGPLVLVKEFFGGDGRPIAAVNPGNLVFTDAYFGLNVPTLDTAYLLCGILNSSLASWFFLLTGAEFGLWKQRLHLKDVLRLPLPRIVGSLDHSARRVVDAASAPAVDLASLDEAVYDFYALTPPDRALIADGLRRAQWEWKGPRDASSVPATLDCMADYAEQFASVVNGWLQARNVRCLRPEILEGSQDWPIRIARFVLERASPRTPVVSLRKVGDDLGAAIQSLSREMSVRLGSVLVGQRELRVHTRNEVLVIKPAATRFWMPGAALDDADAVVAEALTGGGVS